MFNLSPKDDKFFEMFISTARIIHKSAEMLRDYMGDLSDSEEKFKAIKEMEHNGDRQMHLILEELNKSFITPIDREDIYLISKRLDDAIDFIEEAASRFFMYNLDHTTPDARRLGDMIEECSKELIGVMQEFKDMKKSKSLKEKIIEVNRIENEGDIVFRVAIRKLFSDGSEALEVIKWKDIYELLENALDACETVANTVEGVVMKHA